MDSPFIKAQHYHDQAEKLRQLASEESDKTIRDGLLEIADGYERLSMKFLQMGKEGAMRNKK